jgi:hypothetical protein
MKSIKYLFILTALLLAGALVVPGGMPSLAAQTAAPMVEEAQAGAWTGTVEQKEMNGVKTYVLNTGGQTFALEPQDKAAAFVGKTVKVSGKLEGGKIAITAIDEA